MNYNFSISATEHFSKQLKQLSKKYPSIKTDIANLGILLAQEPLMGVPIGRNCYKIRLKITSKKRGKSGGARVITFVKVTANKIVLIDIFDKSDIENVSNAYLKNLLSKIKDKIV